MTNDNYLPLIEAFGILKPFLEDDSVTAIYINGPDKVFVERDTGIEETNIKFASNEALTDQFQKILNTSGRLVNESHPMCDIWLPEQLMLNMVIQPIALQGTIVTIRKRPHHLQSMAELVENAWLSDDVAHFLDVCVKAGLNIMVSGSDEDCIITMMNALAQSIPNGERIVLVEAVEALRLKQDHVVRLEARPPNLEGKGEISLEMLVMNTFRMQPQRILVNQVRSSEGLALLEGVNSGHGSAIFSVRANTPRDAMARLEVMSLMSGRDLPVRVVREHMAAGVDLIVQVNRLRDGSQKVLYITEVQGIEQVMITMSDIFEFEQSDVKNGRIIGTWTATGEKPRFSAYVADKGLTFRDNLFVAPASTA